MRKIFSTILLSVAPFLLGAEEVPSESESQESVQPFSSSELQGTPIVVQTDQTSIEKAPVTPSPLFISLKEQPSFAFSTSYIFWTAREDGLKVAGANYFYVGASKSANPPTIANATQGTDFYPEWKTGSGFKLGATGRLFYDDWNISSEYTWISNGSSQSSDAWPGNFSASPTGATGISVWETDPNAVSDILRSASASWRVFYNEVFLDVGKVFTIGKHFTINPLIGLLAEWNWQLFNIYCVDNFATDFTVDSQCKNWGIGPKLGLNLGYWLGSYVSLFLNAYTSLDFSGTNYQNRINFVTFGTTSTWSKGSFTYVSSLIDLSLGVGFEQTVRDLFYRVQLAWEQKLISSQNHMVQLEQGNFAYGDLSFQGLTATVDLGF